jgi:hypothetical protein
MTDKTSSMRALVRHNTRYPNAVEARNHLRSQFERLDEQDQVREPSPMYSGLCADTFF